MTSRTTVLDRLGEDFAWSPRQRQVLDLLAKGRSNAEIAAELGVSLDGAKWHVREVLSKLGAESRDEAAEYWRAYNGWRLRFSRALGGFAAWKIAAGVGVAAGVAAGGLVVAALLADDGDSNGGSPSSVESPTAGPTLAETPMPGATETATTTEEPSPTALPAAPTVERAMRLVNVDGSGERELAVEAGRRYAWSPDRELVAEASQEHGITLVDPETGTREQVFGQPAVDVSWSPDGTSLVVTTREVLYVTNLEGHLRMWGTREGRIPMQAWDYHWLPEIGFAWNAYGENVVLTPNEGRLDLEGNFYGFQPIGGGELVAVEAETETSDVTLVRFDAATGDRLEEVPVPAQFGDVGVAPDGSYYFYFVRLEEGFDYRMTIVDWETGTEVVGEAAPPRTLDFRHHDGGVFVATDLCGENESLAIARPDGSLEQLVNGLTVDPEVSPDGTMLAYSTGLELYVMPIDGSAEPILLAEDVHGPAGLTWTPDGSAIAVSPYLGGFGLCS